MNSSPKMKAQIMVFNDALASFIDYLDDVDVLAVLVQKLANNHTARGLTVKEFQVCICLFFFLFSLFSILKEIPEQWR